MAKILLVDDDERLLALLKEILEEGGYECRGAQSVTEAERALREEVFEVVLSDYDMPGAKGLDLLRHVAANYTSTGFIMMTGSAEVGIREKAEVLGADAYLNKPFSMKVLLRLVRRTIARHWKPIERILLKKRSGGFQTSRLLWRSRILPASRNSVETAYTLR